jgi:hypothetical protein
MAVTIHHELSHEIGKIGIEEFKNCGARADNEFRGGCRLAERSKYIYFTLVISSF